MSVEQVAWPWFPPPSSLAPPCGLPICPATAPVHAPRTEESTCSCTARDGCPRSGSTSPIASDKVEGSYLGDLLNGKHEGDVELSTTSPGSMLSGGGPGLFDSGGNRWAADWVDSIGEPSADLRSVIAAEARAKIVYERLVKVCEDPGLRDTLNFLMTRQIAHQQMFEAAAGPARRQLPTGQAAGRRAPGACLHPRLRRARGQVSSDGAGGFELAQRHKPDRGFELHADPTERAAQQTILWRLPAGKTGAHPLPFGPFDACGATGRGAHWAHDGAEPLCPAATASSLPVAATCGPAVQALGLSKRDGEIDAARAVYFEVAGAEIFALPGPNGAGRAPR